MKCPYCGYRMFKDEETGIKTCYSCEQKKQTTKERQKDKKTRNIKSVGNVSK